MNLTEKIASLELKVASLERRYAATNSPGVVNVAGSSPHLDLASSIEYHLSAIANDLQGKTAQGIALTPEEASSELTATAKQYVTQFIGSGDEGEITALVSAAVAQYTTQLKAAATANKSYADFAYADKYGV